MRGDAYGIQYLSAEAITAIIGARLGHQLPLQLDAFARLQYRHIAMGTFAIGERHKWWQCDGRIQAAPRRIAHVGDAHGEHGFGSVGVVHKAE